MIYTVTLNPSIDYIMQIDSFSEGAVNRAKREFAVPGGKGINVSVMLSRLGVENTALGFLAGFTGEEIRRSVRARGCKEQFLMLDEGFSRINVKLKAQAETEINGQGPDITEGDVNALFAQLSALQKGDILVLSGSVPHSVLQTIYRDMMALVTPLGVKVAVDAAGALLLNVLSYRPFLIKPNHHELGEFFGVTIETRAEAAYYAKKMQEMGALNVLVSMAGMGAVLVCEDGQILECDAPHGKLKNSVGAGDSMLAGFLAGFLDDEKYEKALILGIASGSATAFCDDIAKREDVLFLYDKIRQDMAE